VLVSELVAYQAERLPSGSLRYGAPGSQHDDTVMALAMAWTAVSEQHRLVYPIADHEIIAKDFAIPSHWPAGIWSGHQMEYSCRNLGCARSCVGRVVSVQRVPP
jgi:hypothetical protein